MTVDNADEIRDFYSAVIGWKSEEIEMNKGEYYDFSMYSEDPTSPTAGICNQKGPNKGLPTGWIVYFGVTDIKKSINRAMEFGGEILTEVREMPLRPLLLHEGSQRTSVCNFSDHSKLI